MDLAVLLDFVCCQSDSTSACSFFGAEANNAVRWLDFGFIRFQPSDPTKILMILFFAQFLTKHRKIKSSSHDHGSDCFDHSLFVFDLQAA